MLNMSSSIGYRLGVLWSVLAVGTASSQASSADPLANAGPSITAIVGATVIDGTGAPPLAGATVLLRGSRIAAVGPERAVPVPPGATVLDGRGLFVLPGFIEAGYQLTWNFDGDTNATRLDRTLAFDARNVLQAGVTTLRDSYGVLAPLHRLRDSIRAGRVLGPRLFVSGEIFGYGAPTPGDSYREPSTRQISRELTGLDADSLRMRINQRLDRGMDFLRYGTTHEAGEEPWRDPVVFSAEAQRIIVEEAHKRGLMVETHAASLDGLRAALEAGVDIIQHPYVVRKRNYGPALPLPDDLVQLIARRPVICTMSSSRSPGIMHTSDADRTADRVVWQENARKLVRAGCPVAIALDEPGGPNRVGHLKYLVDSLGMTPMEALVAATRNGARAAGMLDQLGTVESGKLADLVVLRVDPLRDIGRMEWDQIAMVFKDGERVDLDMLDRVDRYRSMLWNLLSEAGLSYSTGMSSDVSDSLFPVEGATPQEQLARKMERQRQLNWQFELLPVRAVIDSLASASLDTPGVRQRLVQLVAEHFRVLRSTLTPAQQTAIEPRLREWMRQRAAEGTPVTIPGLP